MKLFLQYFGVLVFVFVLLVGALLALSGIGMMPETSAGEILGLVFGFVAIAGGFAWYYIVASDTGRQSVSVDEQLADSSSEGE